MSQSDERKLVRLSKASKKQSNNSKKTGYEGTKEGSLLLQEQYCQTIRRKMARLQERESHPLDEATTFYSFKSIFSLSHPTMLALELRGQYVIRIPKREVAKVQHLVEAHIPASMRHLSGYNNGGRIHPLISPLSSLYLVPLVEYPLALKGQATPISCFLNYKRSSLRYTSQSNPLT